MSKVMASRANPLDEKLFAINSVSLTPAPQATRYSLRIHSSTNGKAAAEKALGFKLPSKPKTTVTNGSVTCLWLSPDEWFLFDESTNASFEKLEKIDASVASVVDISHRNCALTVTGKNAVTAMNAGCPQDLSLEAFPVGAASRTIYGKAEILLYRTAENEFRIECWRSFADYVWIFLQDAAKTV